MKHFYFFCLSLVGAFASFLATAALSVAVILLLLLLNCISGKLTDYNTVVVAFSLGAAFSAMVNILNIIYTEK